MVDDDCQVRVKKDVRDKLDGLEFVQRKETYSQTVETLTSFYQTHKPIFKKWWTNKKKQKT